MASMILQHPLRRHFKSRFTLLRHKLLNEGVATDHLEFDVASPDGYKMAQVFYGLKSRRRWVFPMRTESEFPDVYKDFIRLVGIPMILRCDNAQSEKSNDVIDTQRTHTIADGWSEPYCKQQNPVELNGIKYLKEHAEALLDHTEAPKCMWLLALEHICNLTNHMADPYNNWQIPNQIGGEMN